jgi:hypothetical protein
MDVCNDGDFGERSTSDCDELFALSLIGTERAVLRQASLPNKVTFFLYTFRTFIFVLIMS